MEAVKAALIRQGFQIYQGKVLQNLDGNAMLNAYRGFVNDHGFDPNNRLVLFYAGHGHTRGSGAGEKGYIVPVNAPSPKQDDRGFARTAIEMTFIDALMKRIESRHALFLFDSCFSGSIFATRGADDADEVPPYISAAQREAVRYYITAGSAKEEVPALSTFTPAFVDALNKGAADYDKDGYTLGSELAQYLRKQVALFTKNTVHRGTVRDYRLSQGDIVFVSPTGKMRPVTPRTATRTNPFVNSLGMKFVPVPGTDTLFSIWETRVQDYAAYAAANSGMDGAWKDYEYKGHKQGPDHPVVNVILEDATKFCEWLSKKEGVTYRLPTDHEWSVAVGIGDRENASASPEDKDGEIMNVYPWGTSWPPTKNAGNYSDNIDVYEDSFPFTAPVGSFSANYLGLHDLGGNVWEWCEDRYSYEESYRVLRGGSWGVGVEFGLRSSFRRSVAAPTYRGDDLGFRCVLVVGGGG